MLANDPLLDKVCQRQFIGRARQSGWAMPRFFFHPYIRFQREMTPIIRPVRPTSCLHRALSRHVRRSKNKPSEGGGGDDAIQSLLRTAEDDDDDDDDATPSSPVLPPPPVGRDATVLLLPADSATSLPTKRPIEHILAPSTSSGR